MRTMQPAAVVEVTFLYDRGGRTSPNEAGRYPYGCPIVVNGHGFDCRFVFGGTSRGARHPTRDAHRRARQRIQVVVLDTKRRFARPPLYVVLSEL